MMNVSFDAVVMFSGQSEHVQSMVVFEGPNFLLMTALYPELYGLLLFRRQIANQKKILFNALSHLVASDFCKDCGWRYHLLCNVQHTDEISH